MRTNVSLPKFYALGTVYLYRHLVFTCVHEVGILLWCVSKEVVRVLKSQHPLQWNGQEGHKYGRQFPETDVVSCTILQCVLPDCELYSKHITTCTGIDSSYLQYLPLSCFKFVLNIN